MRPRLLWYLCLLYPCGFVLLLGMTLAAEQTSEPAVAAMVDGRPILVEDVQRQLKRVAGDREITASARPMLEAAALQRVVDRQLVLDFLQSEQLAASPEEVSLALQRLEKQLSQQDKSLDDYYQQTGLDEAAMRRSLQWQLSWSRYLDRYLTDENLQRYFAQHRSHFDGSELRVAHILLKVGDPDDADAQAAAIERAEQIRTDIQQQKIDFAAAARQYSQAPTAEAGGDIGWIQRRRPMPEAFSRAAFALDPGAVSQPVISPFGVHLIQVQEKRAGQKTWQEVRPALKQAVEQFLFQWAADRRRADASIQYTGATPYFEPDTGELIF